MPSTPHRRLVALALVGLLLSSCVTTQLPPVSSSGAAFEPTPDEVELWNDARLEEVQLRNAVALYEDPALESYLDRVAAGLTPPAMAVNPHLHFEVWVVDDPTLNAFAYPHGPLYLHTGLLARMENEAQLATVLGHEMSHVEHRHMLRYRRALQNREVALLTAAIAAEILLAGEEYNQWKDGDWGEAVLVGVLGDVIVGLGLQLAFLASVNGYGRDLETEADHAGFRKLAAAGYDVAQAPRLYEILLEGAGGDSGRTENFFFGSHPRLTERIHNARAWVETHPDAVAPATPADRLAANDTVVDDTVVDDTVVSERVAPAGTVAETRTAVTAASDTAASDTAASDTAASDTVASDTVASDTVASAGTAAPTAPGTAAPAGTVAVGDDVRVGDGVTVGTTASSAAPGTAPRPSSLRGEPVGPAPGHGAPPSPGARPGYRPGLPPVGDTGEAAFRYHVQPVVVHEAWSSLNAGYLDLAESFVHKALGWNPEDPWAHHVLGLLRLQQSRQAAPDDPDAAHALREDARAAFLEAVRLDADLPDPHRELGFLHDDDGLLQDACRELGFYLDLAPGAEDARRVHDHLRDLQRQGAC